MMTEKDFSEIKKRLEGWQTGSSHHPWLGGDACDLLKEVERLRQLTTPQPIETAPKDGTRFIAYQKYRDVCGCWWMETEGWCGWQNDADSEPEPTHWLPLPKVEGV